jgi:lipoprotein NlpI
MKELLEFTKAKRKQRAHSHYEMAKIYGSCSGMGNRRYKVNQKMTFRKGKSQSCSTIWNYTSSGVIYKLNTNLNG